MASYFLSGTRLEGFERMMMQVPRPASRYCDEPESDEAVRNAMRRSQTLSSELTQKAEAKTTKK